LTTSVNIGGGDNHSGEMYIITNLGKMSCFALELLYFCNHIDYGIWLNKVNFYIGIMRSGSEKEEALHSTDKIGIETTLTIKQYYYGIFR